MTVTERIAELREYAREDGVSLNESSFADFFALYLSNREIAGLAGPYLFLLDNGNIRSLWKGQLRKRRLALEFLGEERARLVTETREPFTFSLDELPEALTEENFFAFADSHIEGIGIS